MFDVINWTMESSPKHTKREVPTWVVHVWLAAPWWKTDFFQSVLMSTMGH